MIFHVAVRRSMTFRHYLYGDFGPESQPHSHPYVCEWRLYGDTLDRNGFLADISLLKQVLETELRPLDSQLLNDIPEFLHTQTSVEEVARWLCRRLWTSLAGLGQDLGAITQTEVRVYEDEGTWASVTLTKEELA